MKIKDNLEEKLNNLLKNAGILSKLPSSYSLLTGGGKLKKVIGFTLLFTEIFDELRKIDLPFAKYQRLYHRGIIEIDPVGAIACEKPFLNEKRFKQKWKEEGIVKAVTDKENQNSVFLALGRELIFKAGQFCEVCGIDGTKIITDTLYWDRLTQCRWCLYGKLPSHYPSLEFNEIVKKIRSTVPDEKRQLLSPLGLRFTLPVKRRTSKIYEEQLAAIWRGRFLDAKEKKLAIQTLKRTEAFEASLIDEMPLPKDIEARLEKASNYRSTQALRTDALHYESSVSVAGEFGLADVEIIIQGVLRAIEEIESSSVADYPAIWTAAGLVTFTQIEDLEDLQLDTASWTVSSLSALPQTTIPVEASLHEPAEPRFVRPITHRIGKLFHDARKRNGSKPNKKACENFLQKLNPFATLAKLYRAQECLCPQEFGYPSVLAQTGLHPRDVGLSAQRNYIHISRKFWELATPWYCRFDRDYQVPKGVKWQGHGSAFTPKLDEVKTFVSIWKELFRERWSKKIEDFIVYHNALVAGLHMICTLLLRGARNYPLELNSLKNGEEEWEILYQKALVFVPWGQKSQYWVKRYQKFRENIIAAFRPGFSFNENAFSNAYCFCKWNEKTNIVIPQKVCAKNISLALLSHPKLQRWAYLDDQAMRHLSMTSLYESGKFHPHDIEAFHGRSPIMLQSLKTHRLEDPLCRRTHEAIEEFLAEKIGL